MAISISRRGTPAKKGGGGLGKMLGLGAGALIGGIAAIASGGTAAPAIGAIAKGALGGAATGAGVGGMVGEAVKPGMAPGQPKGPEIDNNKAMQRREQLLTSQQNMKALRDAAVSLPEVDPETRAQAAQPILQAYQTESQKLRGIG